MGLLGWGLERLDLKQTVWAERVLGLRLFWPSTSRALAAQRLHRVEKMSVLLPGIYKEPMSR